MRASDGRAIVDEALALLGEGLGPFVERECAKRTLPAERLADFERSNSRLKGKPISQWDVADLLKFMQYMWKDVFRCVLGPSERGFVTELQGWRNKWAHREPLPTDDIDRALDSAARLLRAINAESQAAQVAALRKRLAQPTRMPGPAVNPRPSSPQSRPPHGSQADAIRQYAMANYVVPWRESGGDVLTIRAGDVVREMGLRNATPNVCSALEGPKFRTLANLALVHRDGPRRSTTTTYHYRCTK